MKAAIPIPPFRLPPSLHPPSPIPPFLYLCLCLSVSVFIPLPLCLSPSVSLSPSPSFFLWLILYPVFSYFFLHHPLILSLPLLCFTAHSNVHTVERNTQGKYLVWTALREMPIICNEHRLKRRSFPYYVYGTYSHCPPTKAVCIILQCRVCDDDAYILAQINTKHILSSELPFTEGFAHL